MTTEEIQAKVTEATDKANQLSIESNPAGGLKYGKVQPLIVEKTNSEKEVVEVIVGFIKPATRKAKMMAMNYISKQEIDRAGELILNSSLIPELSDPRLTVQSTDDAVYMSASLICVGEIEVYSSYIKKN
jgi:hypothetical protein